jgi:hypothetical protein
MCFLSWGHILSCVFMRLCILVCLCARTCVCEFVCVVLCVCVVGGGGTRDGVRVIFIDRCRTKLNESQLRDELTTKVHFLSAGSHTDKLSLTCRESEDRNENWFPCTLRRCNTKHNTTCRRPTCHWRRQELTTMKLWTLFKSTVLYLICRRHLLKLHCLQRLWSWEFNCCLLWINKIIKIVVYYESMKRKLI